MTVTRRQTTFGRAGKGGKFQRPGASTASAASSFEFYWPYYFGVGGPGVVYLCVLAFAIAAQLQVNPIIATVTLIIGAPLLMAGFLVTAFIATKALAGVRGAAGGIGAVRNFALANQGGQLGLVAGFAFFYFRQKEQIDAIFSGGAPGEAPSMLLLAMFGHMGVGMLIGDIIYKKMHKTEDAEPKSAIRTAPQLPQLLVAFIKKWPLYIAGACASIAFVSALAARALAETPALSPAGIAIDACFCVLAFFVLRLYFAWLAKILTGAHWLFGKVGELM